MYGCTHIHFHVCEHKYVRYICIICMLGCMHQPVCMGILLLVLCVHVPGYLCIYLASVYGYVCFPGGSVVKNLSANTGDMGDADLILESRRSPGGANGNSLQYYCWESSWIEGPGRLHSLGSKRARHNWATKHTHIAHTHTQHIWIRVCVYVGMSMYIFHIYAYEMCIR